MTLLDRSFSASKVLVYGVSELHLAGTAASVISKRYGISAKIVELIVNMSPQDVPLFCQIVEARNAANMQVNFDDVIAVAESIISWNESQIIKLNSHYDAWFKRKPLAEASVDSFKYKMFIDYLISTMADIHNEQKVIKIPVPPRLTTAIHDMTNGVWPLFKKALMLQEVIKISIDSESLDMSMAAYKARSSQQKIVIDLIRAGADWSFIQKYNGLVTVDTAHYKRLRSNFNIESTKEVISVKRQVEIMVDFKRLMDAGLSTIDVYFNLRRIYKLRIETLYYFVEEILAGQVEEDDDEEDFDFVKALD